MHFERVQNEWPNNINVTAITVLKVTDSSIKAAKLKVEKKGTDEDIEEERECSILVAVPIQCSLVALSSHAHTN